MVMNIWLKILEFRLLHVRMYVCEISRLVHDTSLIISNQVTEAKMHTEFLHLWRYVHQSHAKECVLLF